MKRALRLVTVRENGGLPLAVVNVQYARSAAFSILAFINFY